MRTSVHTKNRGDHETDSCLPAGRKVFSLKKQPPPTFRSIRAVDVHLDGQLQQHTQTTA